MEDIQLSFLYRVTLGMTGVYSSNVPSGLVVPLSWRILMDVPSHFGLSQVVMRVPKTALKRGVIGGCVKCGNKGDVGSDHPWDDPCVLSPSLSLSLYGCGKMQRQTTTFTFSKNSRNETNINSQNNRFCPIVKVQLGSSAPATPATLKWASDQTAFDFEGGMYGGIKTRKASSCFR